MNFEFAPGVDVGGNENVHHRPSKLSELVSPANNVFKNRITITSGQKIPFNGNQAKEEEEEEEQPYENKDDEISWQHPSSSANNNNNDSKKENVPVIVEKKVEVIIYKPYVSVKWLFQLLLFFIATFFTTIIVLTMVRGNYSLSEAVQHSFGGTGSSSSFTQTGGSIKRQIYPLWIKQHETKSHPLTLKESFAKPLISSLEHSFRYHMETGTQYSCLCMHHLKVPGAPDSMRICSVYNRNRKEMDLMVNPALIGRGNQTDFYEELSVSCDENQPQTTKRYRQVFLEWTDPNTHDVLYSKFQGMSAVCLQVALDEMEGNKHCTV